MFFNCERKNTYICGMFQFGLFSMNIVYIAFAAIYLVSFGLLSYNKLEAKKISGDTDDDKKQSTISIGHSPEDKPVHAFHYSDYYTGHTGQEAVSSPAKRVLPVPLLSEKIPDRFLYLPTCSRPPPTV